jgi:hypothetical protein
LFINSDEKEHDDQNNIVSDMTTKFDDLKYKQQQETEIEIQKLERYTVLMKGFSKWSRGPSWS